MNGDTLKYTIPFVSALKNRRGKLISFVGNEINLPNMGMAPKIKMLQELNVDIIVTQLLLEAGEWLYKQCAESSVLSLPHGLNPSKFYSNTSIKDRKVDIGTRSARYGVYLGDNDRNAIIQYFHETSLGLKVDLGLTGKKENRFDRNGWAKFLNNCKATLATEAGSFYLQANDEIVTNIKKYLIDGSTKIVLPKEAFLRRAYRLFAPSFIRKMLLNLKDNYVVEIDSVDQEADFQKIYDNIFCKNLTVAL